MECGYNSTEAWTFALVAHATTAGAQETAPASNAATQRRGICTGGCQTPDFPRIRQLLHQLVRS